MLYRENINGFDQRMFGRNGEKLRNYAFQMAVRNPWGNMGGSTRDVKSTEGKMFGGINWAAQKGIYNSQLSTPGIIITLKIML